MCERNGSGVAAQAHTSPEARATPHQPGVECGGLEVVWMDGEMVQEQDPTQLLES
jgi:hypothetical protein